MINKLQEKHQHLKQLITISWIIITLFFLILMFVYQWQHAHWKKDQQFQFDSNQLAFNIDEFIQEILETTYSLPFYHNELASCEKYLLPRLQSTVFNNVHIAAIVISDAKNNVLCSTIVNSPRLPTFNAKKPALLGPMKIADSDKDVFLLQHNFGQYRIGIYLLRQTFESFIHKNGAQFQYVGFYDKGLHKIILERGVTYADKSRQKVPNSTKKLFGLHQDDENGVVLPLRNLENVELVIHNNPINFDEHLIFSLLLFALPILFFSWWIYRCLRLMMNYRYSLTYALNNALKQHQFFPVYQPIWDNSQNCYSGAEVLLRWNSDFNEIIMPDYFIDEAEKSGLIVPVTLQLIETVFKECPELLQQNRDFHLAFNLSLSHFISNDFFTKFYDLCEKYAIPAKQLMLEMTERQLFNQLEPRIIDKMNECRDNGYLFAIDDFGTGHASINYLQHFPFNFLKIDKIFVQAIGTGAITETLNLAIINMANSLSLQIIAEGVETKEQLDYLRNNQVRFIQGWYFSKALDYKHLVELIQKDSK